MRQFLILVLLHFLGQNICISQSLTIYGIIDGSKVDTLILGLDQSATLDIDSEFEENDISSNSFDEFELRILQRKENNFQCLYDFNDGIENKREINFSIEFDSKVNIRNIQNDNHFFEIRNFTKNFTRIRLETDNLLNENISKIWTLGGCDDDSLLEADISKLPLNSLDFTLNESNDDIETMIIELKPSISNSTSNIHSDVVVVFPNPAKDILNITTNEPVILADLFDLMGKKVKCIKLNRNNIDISNLHCGVYILKVVLNSGIYQTVKIIKE